MPPNSCVTIAGGLNIKAVCKSLQVFLFVEFPVTLEVLFDGCSVLRNRRPVVLISVGWQVYLSHRRLWPIPTCCLGLLQRDLSIPVLPKL